MRRQTMVKVALMMIVLLLASVRVGMCETVKKGPPAEERQWKGAWQEDEKKLGLSPEQQAQMKAVRESFRAKQQALRGQIKAKHEALRQELDSNTPDRTKAEAILKDINSLQAQIGSNRIEEIFQIRAILTPEQFKKLKEFREKRRTNMQEGMQKGKIKGRFHEKEFPGPGPEGE